MASKNSFVLGFVVIFVLSTGLYLSQTSQFQEQEPSGIGDDSGSLTLSESSYVTGDSTDQYLENMMSGGPPQDGIPSVDDPEFMDADEADLDPGDKVVGIVKDGEARAYPQDILVHHEIVNDDINGEKVAITYCPLTATSQGFKTGDTTLGVSGQLVNSNLVLYDRETESYFSQIASTGIKGEYKDETLDEVNLIWTTWENWKEQNPDTQVLTRETGYFRNYDRDPYGDYNPRDGYYADDGTIFSLMHEAEDHHEKEMVLGARTSEETVYVTMEDLESEKVLGTENFVAVYDDRYDTGYIYSGQHSIERTEEGYMYEGEVYEPDNLPLDKQVSVEAFYFAWNSFYPESETY